MGSLYPAIEPYDAGMLAVGDGHEVYWEVAGNPSGAPVVVLHGGPGSGCTAWHRRLFDPTAFRIVMLDQRACGRSRPHAGDASTRLDAVTTGHLIADIERLRDHLQVERWLVWGGSWGSVLGLAYAEAHRGSVTGMILWGVATGSRDEDDWLFRGGLARFFPEQWQQLLDALPQDDRADAVAAVRRRLEHPDPSVRRRAADAWCLWESATPEWPPRPGLADRFSDPRFAMGFARLVTHFVHHGSFLEDGALLRGIDRLAGIPAAIVQARFDMQSPLGSAWALHRAWPGSRLVVVDNAGHDPSSAEMTSALVDASDRFAQR